MAADKIKSIADIMGVECPKVESYGYINPSPCSFENEPARHKLLDIVGDMALIGRPLKGKVIATKPATASTLV